MAKLGEVSIINPKDKIDDEEMLVSFVPMQNVSEKGEIDTSDIRKAKDVMKGFTSFSEGDVLMAKITPCMENGKGAVAKGLCNNRGFGSTEFFVIRPNKSIVCSEWIYYFTTRQSFRLDCERNMTGSAGQKRVPKSYLEKCEIPLPPLETQKKIAANLDKVTHTIDLCNAILEKLDLLVKARFVEMFGDEESPLKPVEELCSDIVDCPHTTPKYEGELKNPAIRTSEIKKGFITWDSMKYVSDEEYEERVSRLRPEAGDIVYAREGTFGNAAVLPKGFKFCLGQRVMLLRPDYTKCTSEYLLHAVISDDVYRQAVGKNNASTVAHVNVKDVKQFMIPFPSIGKQNQFAAFVEQTDKSKTAVKQLLEKAETLKKALMQEYFG